ncbi:hypothetical protein HanIR_Chr12g0594141 [Helianthus annuus]|nr:hypothetical protein HanIR_Chr12g0594141 [Helianthus annuus]
MMGFCSSFWILVEFEVVVMVGLGFWCGEFGLVLAFGHCTKCRSYGGCCIDGFDSGDGRR